jgi:hypothetical protein
MIYLIMCFYAPIAHPFESVCATEFRFDVIHCLGWVKDFPGDTSFFVPGILKRKVERNELGRKTGKGFYHWSGDKRGDPVE